MAKKKAKPAAYPQQLDEAWRLFAALPDHQKQIFLGRIPERFIVSDNRTKKGIADIVAIYRESSKEHWQQIMATIKKIPVHTGKPVRNDIIVRLWNAGGLTMGQIGGHTEVVAANKGKEMTGEAVSQVLRQRRKKDATLRIES